MEPILSIAVLLFGILTWTPFLNGVYSQDQAANMYWVDRSRKHEIVLYRDVANSPVGHFFHTMFMQRFWEKTNTKAFYWIMCLYTTLSSFTMFWVLIHLFDVLSAVLGSVLFSLYIVSPRLEGNWGPFEQLIPLPLLASLLCLLKASAFASFSPIFLAGMLLGHAVLIKQIAVLYVPGYLLILFGLGYSFYHQIVLIAGIIVANALPPLYYAIRHGAFWEYILSTWLFQLPSAINPKKYNKLYAKMHVRGQKNSAVKKTVILKNSRSLPPLLFLAVIGIVLLTMYQFSWLHLGIFFCLLVSVFMIFMRGTYFAHYWLNIIPWLALFAGFGLGEIIKVSLRSGPPNGATIAALLAISILFTDAVLADKKYYVFSKNPYAFLRRIWGDAVANQYQLWAQLGEYIKNSTGKKERILLCGWLPHILLYSGRTHFTSEPCLYTEDYFNIYSMENPTSLGFLEDIISSKWFGMVRRRENEFRKGHPEIIVFEPGGKVDIEGIERLSGVKYRQDRQVGGYPLFRADLELTELLFLYEKRDSSFYEKAKILNGNARDRSTLKTCTDQDMAFGLARTLLMKNPHDITNLLMVADTLERFGKHRLLFDFYRRLIERHLVADHEKLKLLNRLGECLCQQNKYPDAEELFRKVLEVNPNDTAVLSNLGVVCYYQNRHEEAKTYFEKALDLDPNNQDASANLQMLLQ